ncbi:MAG TPA: FAD-dependent oxidoreductase [Chloroflexota bacterium]|nr:FAD-dependent oxidoreductase [Chloroflexota bacterium]
MPASVAHAPGAAEPRRIVVIGGVAAGPKAAARARRRDPHAEITVVERGAVLSYAGCGLPFYVEGLIDHAQELYATASGAVRDTAFFRNVKDITVLDRTEAERVDRVARMVHVHSLVTGERRALPYDSLVLATGATPMRPPIDGIGLRNVFQLHHPSDAVAMRHLLDAGHVERAVVIGGGLIGLETAAALVERHVRVTVVELLDHLLGPLLDPEMATYLEARLRRRLELRLGERVLAIEGDDTGAAAAVRTASGRIDAQLVLVATGVRPNVQLARDAGLEIGPTGAIAVDDRLRTSDPAIFAGGDCAQNVHLVSGEPCFVPLGSTANKHGRVIGDNVTGGDTRFPGVAGTTALTVLGTDVARTGVTEAQARARGQDVLTALVPGHDRAHYYPTSSRIVVKLVARRTDGRLLGAQVVGPGEAAKRIDVLAAALSHHATLDDLADYDLCYAPPINTAIDALAQAANVARNTRDGLLRSLSAADLKAALDAGAPLVVVDVRSEDEVADASLDDPRVVHVPLEQLRGRLSELPRDSDLVVVCAAGVRAYDALRTLQGAGFDRARVLEGGLATWPYPLRRRSPAVAAAAGRLRVK